MEKLSFEEKSFLANYRIAKWFSDTVKKGKPALLWECSEGHRWRATPESFVRDPICPLCHRRIEPFES